MRGGIPNSGTGRSRLSNAGTPDHLPVRVVTAGANATIGRGERIGREADGFNIAVRVVNAWKSKLAGEGMGDDRWSWQDATMFK